MSSLDDIKLDFEEMPLHHPKVKYGHAKGKPVGKLSKDDIDAAFDKKPLRRKAVLPERRPNPFKRYGAYWIEVITA